MSEDFEVLVDKPDEEDIIWQTIEPHPELAAALAGREGDFGKVERGLQIKGDKKIKSWMLSMMRAINGNMYHFTSVFPEKDFKGRETAGIFRNEAITYFTQVEVDTYATRH